MMRPLMLVLLLIAAPAGAASFTDLTLFTVPFEPGGNVLEAMATGQSLSLVGADDGLGVDRGAMVVSNTSLHVHLELHSYMNGQVDGIEFMNGGGIFGHTTYINSNADFTVLIPPVTSAFLTLTAPATGHATLGVTNDPQAAYLLDFIGIGIGSLDLQSVDGLTYTLRDAQVVLTDPPTTVPEPATWLLFVTGIIAVLGFRHCRA